MSSFHWMLRKSYMLILIRLFVGTWKNFGIWTWMVRHTVIHLCVHLTKKRWAFNSGNKDFVSEYFCVHDTSNRFSVYLILTIWLLLCLYIFTLGESHLRGKPYHISALYVVDLEKFRKDRVGDILREQYHALSADPNSLSNRKWMNVLLPRLI